MIWGTVVDNISVDETCGWEWGQKQESPAGAGERCCAHTISVLGLPQEQRAGPRVPVLAGISITPTLFCVSLGNAFLPIRYPTKILLPSYFFLFWLPYANLCFFSHKVSLAFELSEITQFLCFKGLLWPFSSLLVIPFNFEKLSLWWFCAAAQLESRYLNCKSSLTECFTFISFTDSQRLLFSAEHRRVLTYLLFYALL